MGVYTRGRNTWHITNPALNSRHMRIPYLASCSDVPGLASSITVTLHSSDSTIAFSTRISHAATWSAHWRAHGV